MIEGILINKKNLQIKESKLDVGNIESMRERLNSVTKENFFTVIKESVEKIKEENENQNVIMISAVGQKKMVEDALEKGAAEFIEKPFDNDQVKKTIVDVLSN